MKKILAILALATGTAFAGQATLEYQNINGVDGAADQKAYSLTVKENINKNFAGDVQFTNTQTEGTNALTTRLEAGLTASNTYGIVSPYVRVATGEKFSNTKQFSYYSIEPGIQMPVGPFTAKVGYRFRDAYDSANNDTTRTARAGLSYPLTKNDTVGVRYDRVRGDTNTNVWNFNYTRGF